MMMKILAFQNDSFNLHTDSFNLHTAPTQFLPKGYLSDFTFVLCFVFKRVRLAMFWLVCIIMFRTAGFVEAHYLLIATVLCHRGATGWELAKLLS